MKTEDIKVGMCLAYVPYGGYDSYPTAQRVYVVSVDGYKRRDQKGKLKWYHSEVVPADAYEYSSYKYVRGIAVAMLECQTWKPFIVQPQHLKGDYDTYMAARKAHYEDRKVSDARRLKTQRANEARNEERLAQIRERMTSLYGPLCHMYADRTHEEDFMVKMPARAVEILLGLERQ